MVLNILQNLLCKICIVAAVDIAVVGGNNVLCTGEIVTVQCTLMGDAFTWITPDGVLNFIRGRQNESFAGSYQGQFQELNDTHLRSTLTFTFTSPTTINCTDLSANNSTTIMIEGMAHTWLHSTVSG